MKKLFLLVSIFTAIAYQLAFARDYYGYERVGRDDPEYITIDGVRYARVPQEEVIEVPLQYQNLDYDEERVSQPRFRRQSYRQPRYYEVSKSSSSGVRPYIGLDAGISSMKLNNQYDKEGLADLGMKMEDVFDTLHQNFSGVLGMKINRNVAVELFYQKALESEKTVYSGETAYAKAAVKDKLSYKAYGVDLIGIQPVNDSLNALFGLGVAQYRFDGKISSSGYDYAGYGYEFEVGDNEDVGALRFGGGLQYFLTDHIALQAMGRYIHMFDDDIVKYMLEVSLGVRYLF